MKTSLSPQTMGSPFPYGDFQKAFDKLKETLSGPTGYSLLLGESGTGKTTLLRHLAQNIDQRRFNVLYLCHGRASPSALARVLADALHLPLRRTRAETSRLLVQTLRNLPTQLLFWIDESQLIREDTLHEIRLLSEADLEGPPLFSVLLSGLPGLKDRLLAPGLFPLWRRITTRVTLTGLVREEAGPFLASRFGKEIKGRFPEEALGILFEQARGIPALVETLARECLKTVPEGTISREKASEILENFEIY